MRRAIAMGTERSSAKMEDDMMAQGNQKFEPRAREREMRR